MLRRFILVLSASLLAQAAFAGDGTTPVIVFRNHAQRSTEIIYTKSSNIVAPDDCYDFTPTNGDMVASDYLNNYPSAGYSYSPPPAPTPVVQPNVNGFLTAVQADPLTVANNSALLFQLGQLLAIMQADLIVAQTTGSATALQSHWQSAIANFGPTGTQGTWLGTPVINMIQGYAATYNIPLVATP